MALDGALLRKLIQEIEQNARGARVDKIHQPAREEIVLFLRSPGFSGRLLLSAAAALCLTGARRSRLNGSIGTRNAIRS